MVAASSWIFFRMVVWAVQPKGSECVPLSGTWDMVSDSTSHILRTFDACSETLQMEGFWIVWCLCRPPAGLQRAVVTDHFVPALSLEELRNPKFLCHSRIWPALTKEGNCIMPSVFRFARQCQRSNVPWAIEKFEKYLCWMTSQLQELSMMRNVYNMTFDFCAFGAKWAKTYNSSGRSREFADVWALDTTRCHGHKRCSFIGEKHMQQCSRTHRSRTFPVRHNFLKKYERRVSWVYLYKNDTSLWLLHLRSLFCFPVTYPFWSCHEGEMTRLAVQSLLCAESNLWHQGCLAFQSERPSQGVMRDNFLKKIRAQSVNILIRQSLFNVNKENWDRNTPSNSPKAPGTKLKFGNERVHREELSKSVRLMSVVLARRNSGKDHMRRPCNWRDAPTKQHGIWRKSIYKLKNAEKTVFYVLGEEKGMPAPTTSKRPEEREFVVDSGASMHMMSKKESISEEMDTVKRSRTLTAVLTANVEVHTHEEAQVFAHDPNLFVTLPLPEETPEVLSLGKLCEDQGYSCDWVSGQEPRLTKVLSARRTTSYLLSYPPIQKKVRLLDRHHKDSSRREVEIAAGNSMRPASSSS